MYAKVILAIIPKYVKMIERHLEIYNVNTFIIFLKLFKGIISGFSFQNI